MSAVPSEGGRDDGVIVAAGGRAVAIAAVGQAFQAVIGQFPQQDGIVEQDNVVSLDGEGPGIR